MQDNVVWLHLSYIRVTWPLPLATFLTTFLTTQVLMPRPPKYKDETERIAARKAQKRRYANSDK